MLLTEIDAEIYYNQLLEIDRDKQDVLDKRIFAKLQNLLGAIYKTLTAEVEHAFANVFARIVYAHDKSEPSFELDRNVHGLRKYAAQLLRELDFPVSANLYHLGVQTLANVIAFFAKRDIPEELQKVYKELELKKFPVAQNLSRNAEYTRAVVKAISDIRTAKNGMEYFGILCKDEDGDNEQFTQLLWKHNYNDLTVLKNWLSEWSSVHIFHRTKQENKEHLYNSNNNTLVVVDPDNLFNASELAECFQWRGTNSYLYFLKKLLPSSTSWKALQGTMVGNFLDMLVNHPDETYSEAFKKIKRDNALRSIYFGEELLQLIEKNIKQQHFHNLYNFAKNSKTKRKILEPTFCSSAYGILGRLDVMSEDPEDDKRKDIVELKSGSFPQKQTWVNNKMQVVGYHMLLKSTFKGQRTGNSAIFYSKDGATPLRYIAPKFSEERALVHLRNSLVYLFHKIRKNEANDLFNAINTEDFGLYPPFVEDAIMQFDAVYQGCTDEIKLYYQRLCSFLANELYTAKTGDRTDEARNEKGFASLWLEDHYCKAEANRILYDLELIHYDTEHSCMHLKYNEEDIHDFRKDDIAIIYPQQNNTYRPLEQQLLKGSIAQIENGEIQFKLTNKQADEHFIISYKNWAVERDFFERNYWASIQSLFNFLKAPLYKQFLLMGDAEPRVEEVELEEMEGLFPNQKEVVSKALNAKDYFLIQGPPGTGKTSTILVNIVKQNLKLNDKRLFILAFTNRAVDEVCSKLYKNDIDYTLISKRSEDVNTFKNKIKGNNADEWRNELLKTRVVVATVATFRNNTTFLEFLSFDQLIVDEASQLTEAELLGVVSLFEKFILIGDQNQLPAVVVQNEKYCKIDNPKLQELGIYDLRQSLFERLFRICTEKEWTHAKAQLTTHFRMHQSIGNFIRSHYAEGLDEALDRQKDASFLKSYPKKKSKLLQLLSKNRSVFLESSWEANSKTHHQEAIRAAHIVQELAQFFGDEMDDKTIGIITPWRAQIGNIKKRLPKELRGKILVDTVERFQGSERKVIILSLAVNREKQLVNLHAMNFEQTLDRKLLVSLSRASEQLVILGYATVLQKSLFYRELMEAIRKEKGFLGEAESEAVFG